MARVEGVQQELINTQKETEQSIFDFDKIKEQSKNIKSFVHSISPAQDINAEEEMEFIKLYLEILLNMARFEEDQKVAVKRMTYIQWVMDQKFGGGHISLAFKLSIRDLFLESMQLTKESYAKFAKCLHKYISKESPILESVALYSLEAAFIFDVLVVAHISGEPTDEVKKYYVDLFAILGFTRDKLRIVAKYAKESISETQDSNGMLDAHIILKEAKEEMLQNLKKWEKQDQEIEARCRSLGFTVEDLPSMLGQIFGNS